MTTLGQFLNDGLKLGIEHEKLLKYLFKENMTNLKKSVPEHIIRSFDMNLRIEYIGDKNFIDISEGEHNRFSRQQNKYEICLIHRGYFKNRKSIFLYQVPF